MVEVTGFEPAASWSQTKHSTKLSYTSLLTICTATFQHRVANGFHYIAINLRLRHQTALLLYVICPNMSSYFIEMGNFLREIYILIVLLI